MKNIIYISVLLILFSFKTDTGGMFGKYYFSKIVPLTASWVGLEERELVLNPDSTFTYFIHYANSDFPGEYKGKWNMINKKIFLAEHELSNNGLFIAFDVVSNTELSGTEKKEKFILLRKL
jgi:hypothetical protein